MAADQSSRNPSLAPLTRAVQGWATCRERSVLTSSSGEHCLCCCSVEELLASASAQERPIRELVLLSLVEGEKMDIARSEDCCARWRVLAAAAAVHRSERLLETALCRYGSPLSACRRHSGYVELRVHLLIDRIVESADLLSRLAEQRAECPLALLGEFRAVKQ